MTKPSETAPRYVEATEYVVALPGREEAQELIGDALAASGLLQFKGDRYRLADSVLTLLDRFAR